MFKFLLAVVLGVVAYYALTAMALSYGVIKILSAIFFGFMTVAALSD